MSTQLIQRAQAQLHHVERVSDSLNELFSRCESPTLQEQCAWLNGQDDSPEWCVVRTSRERLWRPENLRQWKLYHGLTQPTPDMTPDELAAAEAIGEQIESVLQRHWIIREDLETCPVKRRQSVYVDSLPALHTLLQSQMWLREPLRGNETFLSLRGQLLLPDVSYDDYGSEEPLQKITYRISWDVKDAEAVLRMLTLSDSWTVESDEFIQEVLDAISSGAEFEDEGGFSSEYVIWGCEDPRLLDFVNAYDNVSMYESGAQAA